MLKHWVLFILFLHCGQAWAHGRWLVPSHTVVSGSEPAFVALDMSISNDVFHPDSPYGGTPLNTIFKVPKPENAKTHEDVHPLAKVAQSTRVMTIDPNGQKNDSATIVNFGRKSVTAVQLDQNGTYCFAVQQIPVTYISFTHANGEPGRVWGSGGRALSQLPKGAQSVNRVQLLNRVETYVTRNQSTPVPVQKEGLALRFEQHPNDLFAKEQAAFTLLFNGNPLANTQVQVTRGGTRYRNQRKKLIVNSDAKGQIRFQWPEAGLYLLEVEYSKTLKGESYDTQKHALYVSLEVFPE